MRVAAAVVQFIVLGGTVTLIAVMAKDIPGMMRELREKKRAAIERGRSIEGDEDEDAPDH